MCLNYVSMFKIESHCLSGKHTGLFNFNFESALSIDSALFTAIFQSEKKWSSEWKTYLLIIPLRDAHPTFYENCPILVDYKGLILLLAPWMSTWLMPGLSEHSISLITEIGSGYTKPNPSRNFPEPSESLCSPISRIRKIWKYEITWGCWWPSLQGYQTSLPEYNTSIDRMEPRDGERERESSHDFNPRIQIPSYLSH